ncbi:MAG: SatD family protein [Firmicutes bacterium]|nr:SatD family protein [Bacillota bacterium]
MPLYAAIKGDLIASRRQADRQSVQNNLLAAVEEANEKFARLIVAKFVVTHGDEFQGLLDIAGAAHLMAVYEFFAVRLHPVRHRLALGVGEVATALQPLAIAMDGPAWHLAKSALDEAIDKGLTLRVALPSAFLTKQTNLLLRALGEIESTWRPSHYKVMALIGQGRSQEQAAKELRITQGAVSQRLKHARWRTYQELRAGVEELLAAAAVSAVAPFDIKKTPNKEGN